MFWKYNCCELNSLRVDFWVGKVKWRNYPLSGYWSSILFKNILQVVSFKNSLFHHCYCLRFRNELHRLRRFYDSQHYNVLGWDCIIYTSREICNREVYSLCLVGKICYIAGWGTQKVKGPPTRILHEAALPLVSHEQCNVPLSYSGVIKGGMICAGYKQGGVDTCEGDSGGKYADCWQHDKPLSRVRWDFAGRKESLFLYTNS